MWEAYLVVSVFFVAVGKFVWSNFMAARPYGGHLSPGIEGALNPEKLIEGKA